MDYFQKLVVEAKAKTAKSDTLVAIAGGENKEVLEFVHDATLHQLASFLIFGDAPKIRHLFESQGKDASSSTMINSASPSSDALGAVLQGKASVLMKGSVSTADLLSCVLKSSKDKRTRLSQVGVFALPSYHKPLILTDSGINIAPNTEEKVEILNHAIDLAHTLGVEMPKVAVLSAIEKESSKMPSSLEGTALKKLLAEGKLKPCTLEGPISMDLAVSKEAALLKGFQSPVAGDADILLAPFIEVGNVLYKTFTWLMRAHSASLVMGAPVPIVLTSRSDSAESKLYSLALALLSSKYNQKN